MRHISSRSVKQRECWKSISRLSNRNNSYLNVKNMAKDTTSAVQEMEYPMTNRWLMKVLNCKQKGSSFHHHPGPSSCLTPNFISCSNESLSLLISGNPLQNGKRKSIHEPSIPVRATFQLRLVRRIAKKWANETTIDVSERIVSRSSHYDSSAGFTFANEIVRGPICPGTDNKLPNFPLHYDAGEGARPRRICYNLSGPYIIHGERAAVRFFLVLYGAINDHQDSRASRVVYDLLVKAVHKPAGKGW